MRPCCLLEALAFVGLATQLGAQQPVPASDSARQPFVIERLYERVRYDSDGTGKREFDLRVHVISEGALQAFGQLEYPYNSASDRLDVGYVRVLKTGGDTVVAPASAVLDVTGPIAREAPMFSDIREKVVTVPGLRPGDVLEAHLTWTTVTPVAPGRFWYADDFPEDAIIVDQRLVVDVPRSEAVLVRTSGAAAPEVRETGDRRIYEWRRQNLRVDTSSAGEARRAARFRHAPAAVQVTSFRTWEEVGRWYANLEREREALTPAIRAKADSLVHGRTTLLDSVAAIYDYVSQEFRYVSISFGIGRYQPHAASEVLASEYGDCKDKHVLLASLLRAVGVLSSPALISSERDLDSTVPSPHQFDHLITFLTAGRDTVWLDATPGAAPFRLLQFQLRGQLALVIPLDGAARLVRTPEQPPFALFDSVSSEAAISDARELTATYRYVERGDAETVLRLVLRQLPAERFAELAHEIARQSDLAGTASAVETSDLKATRHPLRFSYQLEQSDVIAWSGQQATYRPPLPRLRLPEADSGAIADSIFLAASQASHRLRLRFPPGVMIQVPLDVTVSRAYATYRAAYRLRGDTVTIERTLQFTLRAVPPDQVPDYVAFRRAIEADQDATLALTRSAAGGDATGGDVEGLAQAAWDALQHGDSRSAVRVYRQVVTRDPRHHNAWNNLGRAFLNLGQPDSARAAFRQAIAVDPNEPYAYNNLGLAEWRLHHNDSAAAAFRRQIVVNPLDQYAHANLGRLALEMHEDSVAVAELRQAAAITPNDATTHINLARAYIAAGDSAQAVEELGRALEIRPSASTLNDAAYALAEAGAQLDVAERYARLAIDSAEVPLRSTTLDNPDFRSMLTLFRLGTFWDTMGWILFRRGDFAGAERYLRAAWLVAPTDGTIGDHLGLTYERLGRKADAIRTYALALNAGNPASGTRERLASLAGGRERADHLVADAGHRGVQEMRTIRLPQLTRESVAGEVQILLGPGPRVEDVRTEGTAPGLNELADKLRAEGASFPDLFPGGDSIRVPLRGLLACSSAAGCSVILLLVTVRNEIREVPVPPPN